MNVEGSSNNDTRGRLAKPTNSTVLNNPLLLGLLMADFGLLLCGFAEWDPLWIKARALLYSVGGLLCSAGLVFIWIGTTKLAEAAQKQTERI